MAYKVSYKVVAEQGEQLKNIAKDMDNYQNQVSQIVSKLGNDELLQSVRNDLNKFKKQLEEEKTILNLAGQVITEVLQSYTGVEKKSVGKVDKAKAHNRDFYKRPVAVASAGGAAGGAAAAGASASAVNVSSSSVVQQQNISNTTNVFSGSAGSSGFSGSSGGFSSGAAGSFAENLSTNASGGFSSAISDAAAGAGSSSVIGSVVAAAGGLAVAGAGIAGAEMIDRKNEKNEKDESEE